MVGRRSASDALTWWGHATVEIRMADTTVLTDPVLTHRVGHLVRRRGLHPPPDGCRPDAVLLSHLHSDHTHLPSLSMIDSPTPIVLPRGAPRRLGALLTLGTPLVEISAGESVDVGSLRVTAVPADHDGRRWRRGPHDVDALGYLVEGPSVVYFAGDTAFYDEMALRVPRCDVALLPVGGWGPTRGHGHMDPGDAVRAATAVHAQISIPIHFGTLWPAGLARIRPNLFHDPGDEFARRATAHGVSATVLPPGGTWPME